MLCPNFLTMTGQAVMLVLFASMVLPSAADGSVMADELATEERSPDELRGSITPERAWWDLRHYRLEVRVDIENRSLEGTNTIRFVVLRPGQRLQIDLQQPMKIRRVEADGQALPFERDGNVCWIDFPEPLEVGTERSIVVAYGGTPTESANPPWSGGLSWKQDENGFIATTCQGIGASIWWPNKDHGYDEPDDGMEMRYHGPKALTADRPTGVSFASTVNPEDGTATFHWRVVIRSTTTAST
jgi:hypothetical protein